jgi:hypothetical protein
LKKQEITYQGSYWQVDILCRDYAGLWPPQLLEIELPSALSADPHMLHTEIVCLKMPELPIKGNKILGMSQRFYM